MLKRLELVGFKSFAQKTTLDFPRGITVIVGPNGSGKSNVIDALRWLLGERDAKKVRGADTESLIFSGTDKKSRVGMAQASVCFDNSAKAFPLEFSEVAITRRIYRDGNSEFFINKSLVRLKDVIDLFAQSKMGTKGFSIVGQGNSDAFIKADPQDRREMIEEILGLRQYQLKKHEANLKLKNTQINLEKAKATIEEILPHLRLLRRQASKWEKRAQYKNDLSALQNEYFGRKIKLLNEESIRIDPAIVKADEQLKILQKELTEAELQVKKIEEQKPICWQVNQKKLDLQKELARLEAQLQFTPPITTNKVSYDKATDLLKEIGRNLKNIAEIDDMMEVRSRLNQLEQKIEKVFQAALVVAVAPKIKELSEKIALVNQELALMQVEEDRALKNLADFNSHFKKAFAAVTAKNDQSQNLERGRNQLLLQKDRWHYQRQDLEAKVKQENINLTELKAILVTTANFDFETAEAQMAKLRNELALIGEIDTELVKEARETEERYQFLATQSSDLERATADLRRLIKELDWKISSDFDQAIKSVNLELAKYFKLLFGGGRARLVKLQQPMAKEAALEEEHLLGGIELEVQIPSKGVKNLAALSGGEKSLTAIAVLFALIAISPPPLLIFDEVDAALDEKNSRRFVELLKNFAQKTQFAIVTHNRAVMEAANVLYGISMDNNGVSQVLSLKLA